jgi:transcriptional regulator with AAA-type ATPase domain
LNELLGTSPAIVALRERVRHVLALRQRSGRLPPVLLQGETGTGKGLLARLIHRAGARAAGPFVDVNCAAIPETLLEAELFGFERGAFTDARQAKPGLVRAAHGGTLFLDEVDLVAPALQAKLLTALEDRVVRPLGSTHGEPVDVWVVAATNRDLEGEVRARRFREDLYHRLAVLTLTLPPLRERREDIVLLAEHLLARECAEYGLPPKTLSPEVRAALRNYAWPGNVRELSNAIERAVLFAEASVITPEIFGLPSRTPTDDREAHSLQTFDSLDEQIFSIERRSLLEALRATDWNISRAARLLGVPRHRLRYQMEKHQLSRIRSSAWPERQTRDPESTPQTATPAPPEAVPPRAARWERRHVTFLNAAVIATPAGLAPATGHAVWVLAEKVEAWGGRVLDMGTTTLVAAFGLEPVENGPTSAVLAAVAMLKAAERARRHDPRGPGVAVAIHVTPVMVGEVNAVVQIDVQDKHAARAALSVLLAESEQGSILVSEAAVPFLDRRFDLVLMGRLDGALGQFWRLALQEASGFRLAWIIREK